jgi:hypothetical protein
VEVLAGNGSRGKGAREESKKLVSDLSVWLRKISGVETVQVLGFAVGPQQKR